MASKEEVKEYLAYWMQLGRSLVIGERKVKLDRVIAGDHYTTRFEEIWQEGQAHPESTCLEGSNLNLQQLLAANYELLPCPRCDLPLPSLGLGPRSAQACPCDDLKVWPNLDTVPPHPPISITSQLRALQERLANPPD
ncbi:MAG: hypothetical protein RMK91_08945 [Pseudanabaenaceae cyanobacterium SKYGB_i_bin29]|nr:hypothetical protein [Pseudanabaenaceae cyanobacterium SKYG29]MDW8421982.1 hypothetical protein [Pseudanabaenaceae cyanobacterium SKYGB_i_bin29]